MAPPDWGQEIPSPWSHPRPAEPPAPLMSSSSLPPIPYKAHWPAVALVLIWSGLAIHTCGAMAVTTDEMWHWPVGMLNLAKGEYSADRLNPPLARMWAAIPGLLAGVQVSSESTHQAIGERFIAEHQDFFRWYVWGRYFNLIWALLTASMVYLLLLHWKGLQIARAGLFSLLCIPDVTAHACLVTPDSAAMAWFLATSIAGKLWLTEPTWKRSIALGTCLGAAFATKYTAVVFMPVLVVLGLIRLFSIPIPSLRQLAWGKGVLSLGLGALTFLLTLALIYRFQGLMISLVDYSFQSRDMQTIQHLAGPLAKLPLPVPRDLLLGIDSQRVIMEGAHPTFLDGQWSLTGFPTYFLWATIYKLPLPILGLSLLGLWIFIRDRHCAITTKLAMLGPVMLLTLIASFSSMQLGFRYLMPALPLVACGCGLVVGKIQNWRPAFRVATLSVLGLVIASSWRYHPHHLSYFNELAGGPQGGRFHLIDSNLDWGQDLCRAKEAVDRYPNEPLWIAYFGQVDPRSVGIDSQGPPPRELLPGLYLVSVNFVMGRPGLVRDKDGQMRAVDIEEFGGFRHMAPIEHIGYSMELYRVTASENP